MRINSHKTPSAHLHNDIIKKTLLFYVSQQDKENSALNKFYEVIMDMGGDVLEDITKLGDVTILAPSNEAWAALNVQNVIR